MRVLLYGASSVAALAACAEMAQAAGARPVARTDRYFQPDHAEPADAVVCAAGRPQSPVIAAAYQARGVPVFAVPADADALAASEAGAAYARLLGLELPKGGADDDAADDAADLAAAREALAEPGERVTLAELTAELGMDEVPAPESAPSPAPAPARRRR